MKLSKTDLAAITLLVVLGLVIFLPNISRPFVGLHDFNGVFYGQIAKNTMRFGLFDIYFGQVVGMDANGLFRFHINHPPLLPLTLAALFSVFGVSEAVTRVLPMSFSVISLAAMYLLGRVLFSRLVGFLAAGFMASTTMFQYFGKTPVFEPLVLAIALVGMLAYILFLQKQRRLYLVLLGICVLLGLGVDWVGFYLLFAISIHAMFFARRRFPLHALAVLWLVQLGILIGLFAHVLFLTGGSGGNTLWQSFLFRTGIRIPATDGLTMTAFAQRISGYAIAYFGRPLLLLAGLWAVRSVMLGWRGLRWQQGFVWTLLLYGIVHPMIARNAAMIHEYILFSMLPFMSLAAGRFLEIFSGRFTQKIAVQWMFAIAFLAIAFISTQTFTTELNRIEYFRPGFTLGTIAKELLRPEEKALVASHAFRVFYAPFATYYADRTLEYAEPTLKEWRAFEEKFTEEYAYVVQVKTHDYLDPNLVTFLASQYRAVEFDDFRFFDLGQRGES